MQKIPTTIITGFLGAGKTTLISHLLNNVDGTRIALIVNEFGDLGIDAEILKGCGLEDCEDTGIVELSNGCICCTVAEEFTPAMEALLDRREPPDHIIIETSGLALPQPLVRAFNWPGIKTRVTVDGVVVVIDGPAVNCGQFASDLDAIDRQRREDEMLDHESPLVELFEDQLVSADLVIISKADLMGPDEFQMVRSEVAKKIRPGTQVLKGGMGTVGVGEVLGLGITAEDDLEQRQEIHHFHDEQPSVEPDHDHDEFTSFTISIPRFDNKDKLAKRLEDAILEHSLLRVKGFASIRNKSMRLVVQAVGPRIDCYYDRPFSGEESQVGRIVVIAETGVNPESVSRTIGGQIG